MNVWDKTQQLEKRKTCLIITPDGCQCSDFVSVCNRPFNKAHHYNHYFTDFVMQKQTKMFDSALLSPKVTVGFYEMLRLGCYLKFIPYDWDNKRKKLNSTSRLGVRLFNLHKNIMYFLTVFTAVRSIQAWKRGELPLPLKLLAAAWFNAYLLTAIGFSQFPNFRDEIMHFGNYVIGRIQNPNADDKHSVNKLERSNLKFMRKERKQLSWHMYIGLFLLITNPGVHTLITAKSLCAPHFISSYFFKCHTVQDEVGSLLEKAPFLVFELYACSLFLYMGWFNWSFILVGLAIVACELKAMGRNTSLLLKASPAVLNFRKLQIIVITLNATFRPYLMCFSTILYSVVSLLLFGSIRLLYSDPGSYIMFPLCAMRCGFEATTPLAMAGHVSQESEKVLEIWRERMDTAINKNFGRGNKELRMGERSCKRILCSAGSLYTFENSIVLRSIDNCIQLTFNLLVTFKK